MFDKSTHSKEVCQLLLSMIVAKEFWHWPEQMLNWSPFTAWRCFPYERRTGELSDTWTSGKSVKEHCADHLPLPVIPETIHTQIPAAITHLLETPSEYHSRNSHFYQLGGDTEDFFYGKISTRFSSLHAADPSVVAEMKEFPPSSWTVLLLPPKRVNKHVQLSFIPGGMLFLLTVLRKINVCDSHCKCYKIPLAVL